MDMRFGTWNVRSMHRAGSFRAVSEEISKYKLELVGVQEVRWDRGGTGPSIVTVFKKSKVPLLVITDTLLFLIKFKS
jgi:hypothetical protein